MTQNTFTIVTNDLNGTLRSTIFASRALLVANVEPMPYEADVTADHRNQTAKRGSALKVTLQDFQDGDFVVRSVVNGSRRKFEILQGAVPASLVAQLPEFADIAENHFIVPASAVSEEGLVETNGLEQRAQFASGVINDIVVLTDGQALVDFPGAVRVN
ncbi:MAG: hypothetical protein SGJ27_21175 [Candidatus Melainabacteria bacterium]|nr:hypothetical protein [Candidatus Melainabacteria bacterium]